MSAIASVSSGSGTCMIADTGVWLLIPHAAAIHRRRNPLEQLKHGRHALRRREAGLSGNARHRQPCGGQQPFRVLDPTSPQLMQHRMTDNSSELPFQFAAMHGNVQHDALHVDAFGGVLVDKADRRRNDRIGNRQRVGGLARHHAHRRQKQRRRRQSPARHDLVEQVRRLIADPFVGNRNARQRRHRQRAFQIVVIYAQQSDLAGNVQTELAARVGQRRAGMSLHAKMAPVWADPATNGESGGLTLANWSSWRPAPDSSRSTRSRFARLRQAALENSRSRSLGMHSRFDAEVAEVLETKVEKVLGRHAANGRMIHIDHRNLESGDRAARVDQRFAELHYAAGRNPCRYSPAMIPCGFQSRRKGKTSLVAGPLRKTHVGLPNAYSPRRG